MTKLSHLGSLSYLPGRIFPADSDIHCPPKEYGWKVDSMGFLWSPRTPKSKFGQESYGLPKLDVMQDPSRTGPIRGINPG